MPVEVASCWNPRILKRNYSESSPAETLTQPNICWALAQLSMHLSPQCHQFSHLVVSNSLWSHGLQHARLPVHHQLPEFTQTHVHWVSDDIQPSHPLLSPSPPSFNLSQHQGLFKWVISSHQMAKVLEFQLQHQSFQWTARTDLL